MGGKVVLAKAGVKQTRIGTLKKGNPPKSMHFLEKGKTAVIFVTGISSDKTFPSIGRYGKDFTYVNEKRILKKQELIEEVKLANSEAALLTGADPLTKIDRCVSYTDLLKKSFGKQFHVSLACPLKLVTPQRLDRLFSVGLDELQVRVNLKDVAELSKLRYLKKYKEVAIEIEAFPDQLEETKQLIDQTVGITKYIIIREVGKNEYNHEILKKYVLDQDVVKGSQSAGHKLLVYSAKKNLSGYYLPISLEATLLEQRMKVKAKSVAKKYAQVTAKGTIKHGVIYLSDMVPCAGYSIKLETVNKKNLVKKLFRIKRDLQRELNIQFDVVDVDEHKLRLTTDAKIVKTYAGFLKNMKLHPALVEEYPTHDDAELNVEFL